MLVSADTVHFRYAMITTAIVTALSYVSGGMALFFSSSGSGGSTGTAVFTAVLTLFVGAVVGTRVSERVAAPLHEQSAPTIFCSSHEAQMYAFLVLALTRALNRESTVIFLQTSTAR